MITKIAVDFFSVIKLYKRKVKKNTKQTTVYETFVVQWNTSVI